MIDLLIVIFALIGALAVVIVLSVILIIIGDYVKTCFGRLRLWLFGGEEVVKRIDGVHIIKRHDGLLSKTFTK